MEARPFGLCNAHVWEKGLRVSGGGKEGRSLGSRIGEKETNYLIVLSFSLRNWLLEGSEAFYTTTRTTKF